MADDPDDEEALDRWLEENSIKPNIVAIFDQNYPPRDYDVHKSDIGGLESVLEKFESFRIGIEHRQMYDFMGVTPPNGFILHGKPGTGKTYLAKYLAHTLDARFVDLPLNQFESKWVGEAEKALTQHIENMRTYYKYTKQKVLLFFDEAEEAFKSRSLEGWHGPRVNVLLREMDGLGDNNGIIFGAATNHLEKVDAALLRAGRLDFLINIPDYDSDGLKQVYIATANKHNRKAPHYDPYQINATEATELGVLAYSKGLVPADISEIFRLAAETKIKDMVYSDKKVFENEDYIITYKDLETITKEYCRVNENNKRNIGF